MKEYHDFFFGDKYKQYQSGILTIFKRKFGFVFDKDEHALNLTYDFEKDGEFDLKWLCSEIGHRGCWLSGNANAGTKGDVFFHSIGASFETRSSFKIYVDYVYILGEATHFEFHGLILCGEVVNGFVQDDCFYDKISQNKSISNDESSFSFSYKNHLYKVNALTDIPPKAFVRCGIKLQSQVAIFTEDILSNNELLDLHQLLSKALFFLFYRRGISFDSFIYCLDNHDPESKRENASYTFDDYALMKNDRDGDNLTCISFSSIAPHIQQLMEVFSDQDFLPVYIPTDSKGYGLEGTTFLMAWATLVIRKFYCDGIHLISKKRDIVTPSEKGSIKENKFSQKKQIKLLLKKNSNVLERFFYDVFPFAFKTPEKWEDYWNQTAGEFILLRNDICHGSMKAESIHPHAWENNRLVLLSIYASILSNAGMDAAEIERSLASLFYPNTHVFLEKSIN